MKNKESISRLAKPKRVWLAEKDPQGSGLIYYWNTETKETTALGTLLYFSYSAVYIDEGGYCGCRGSPSH